MKKYILYITVLFLSIESIKAQTLCEKKVAQAEKHIKGKSPFNNAGQAVKLLEDCAAQGNAAANHYMGLFYLNGMGVAQNDKKAFEHMLEAAQNGHAIAQYNLGRLYKYGTGCTIDFEKAVAWFEKAAAQNNHKASYSLGYMYFKGFGVQQDYNKAVHWLQQSKDPMGRHWLGICHYFGYGTPANEEKALELLLDNKITNSKTMVRYIYNNRKVKLEAVVQTALKENSKESSSVARTAVTSLQEEEKETNLEEKELQGTWIGKLVQYDWSGKEILHIHPIEVGIDSKDGLLKITTLFDKQQQETQALWQNGQLYLEKLPIVLPILYPNHPRFSITNYSLLSMGLKAKTINGTLYLTGAVDGYIDNWTEYSSPMGIVLKAKNRTATENKEEELLEALAAQAAHFVKLYPIPFKQDLAIQYHLETAGQVKVAITNYQSTVHVVVEPGKWQEAGEHLYHIDSALPEGIYIVQVTVGNKMHTRMVVKEN